MRSVWQRLGAGMGLAIFVAALGVSLLSAAEGKTTLTGEVGDVMCGAKHMGGSAAECTRGCVKHGSKYALIVKDKVYTLETTDQAALAELDKLAGEQAKVTGSVSGTTVEVSSVMPAK